jgi:hypothetical protein
MPMLTLCSLSSDHIQVQIQLDRQKYLQDRAGQDESALRVQDERIPTGASRPMLTPQEQAECEVSAADGTNITGKLQTYIVCVTGGCGYLYIWCKLSTVFCGGVLILVLWWFCSGRGGGEWLCQIDVLTGLR